MDLRVTMDLAGAYAMAGRHHEATAAYEQASAELAAFGRGDTETASTLFNNWGISLRALGPTLEAERAFRRSVQISSPDGTAQNMPPMPVINLARILRELHRLPEAAKFAELAYAKALRAGNEVVISQSLTVRADIYRELGNLGRAASMISELEPRVKRLLPPGHIAFASLASEHSLLAQARGDARSALADADRALAIAEAGKQGHDYLPLLLLRRSSVLLQLQRAPDAEADARRVLSAWSRHRRRPEPSPAGRGVRIWRWAGRFTRRASWARPGHSLSWRWSTSSRHSVPTIRTRERPAS
jgi:tetratricopeptide (TPR) repeat protein